MPVVIIHMWSGRDKETKRRTAEGITNVFKAEQILREAMTIIVKEILKENWMYRGVMASDIDFAK